MNVARNSLREMVKHSPAADLTNGLRVTEFRNKRSKQKCHVRVEPLKAAGPTALYFVRHQDGAWRIFRPDQERPAIRATQNPLSF